MKRKGFTLIELLAVIVILAVISLITIPMIGNIIEDSRKKALETSVNGIVEAANYFTISNDGVYEFLFNENKKGETKEGNHTLDYKGQVDAKGSLYIDNDGNISLCLMNENYYVYKNYNSGIYIGNRTESDCAIKYDALTNKYIAYLDDGTGTVAEYYTKSEINVMIENINTSLSNYALKSELEETNNNVDSLTSIVSNLQQSGLNMRYNSETDMVEIYYNNEWIEWANGNLQATYLYNSGEELVTWVVNDYNLASTYVLDEATKNSTNVLLAVTATNSTTSYLGTNESYDFTGYNELVVEFIANDAEYVKTVDISGMTAGYICLFLLNNSSSSSNKLSLFILDDKNTLSAHRLLEEDLIAYSTTNQLLEVQINKVYLR